MASGWVARPECWDSFSKKWKLALDADPKISYFKLNDALGLKGPFAGWTEKDRDAKLIALMELLPHDGTVFGTGCYLHRDDFEKAKQYIRRKIYREPYYFCIATAMIFSAAGENQIIGVDKIDFILDHSNAAERMRRLFYEHIKPTFAKLGECITLDDKETLPLQAADLSAGAIRQLYESSPRRIPGISTLNGLFAGVFELHAKGIKDAIASPVFSGTGSKPDPSC